MKKTYMKPAMKVYELQRHQMILCGSPNPDYWGYTPGIDKWREKAVC